MSQKSTTPKATAPTTETKGSDSESDLYQTITKFEDAKLSDALLKGIYSYGWEKPSAIQQKGIPAILTGRDVIMQAQSGMGKTGTFSISVLNQIDPDVGAVQGIIILPTRELADQVHKVIQALGDNMDVNFVKCVGKTHVRDRLQFENRATIVIGTPGKVSSVLSKRVIKSQQYKTKILVIDEFDKTLEENFIPTIREIFERIDRDTQVVLSSATINSDVLDISHRFMRDPITITIKEDQVTLDGIKQFYIDCNREDWKFDTILDLYKSVIVAQSIIYVNSKRKCDQLEEMFIKRDFTIASIHGDMSQEERDAVMNEFRANKIRILLSTDLTARGIDVPGVSLVINYELPIDKAQYIHRIGRTGRYGKKGVAINLIGNRHEMNAMRGIEDYYSTAIMELPADFTKLLA